MRNFFERLAERLGRAALGLSGETNHVWFSSETEQGGFRYEPDPRLFAERARLGLLGRMAAVRCRIATYSRAFQPEEFRACMQNHLACWNRPACDEPPTNEIGINRPHLMPELPDPFLWIIAAATQRDVMAKLVPVAAPGWPHGVYFLGDDVLRVGIIVACELPRSRCTLLVRLMAAGPLLTQAIEDLQALSSDAQERVVADRVLLQAQCTLEQRSGRTSEEQGFIAIMRECGPRDWTRRWIHGDTY